MGLRETMRGWCVAVRSKRDHMRDSAVIASQRHTIEENERSAEEQRKAIRQKDERIAELESMVRIRDLELEKLGDVCARDRERVLAETATMTTRVAAPNIQLAIPPTDRQNVA